MRDVLEEKHPEPKPAHAETIVSLLNNELTEFHPIIFESITPEVIRKCALQTQGAAGPSGVDAMHWRRFCTAFGEKSNDLCSALARFAKRLCTSYVDPAGIMAYTACRSYSIEQMSRCATNRNRGSGSKNHWKSYHEVNKIGITGSCGLSPTLCGSKRRL